MATLESQIQALITYANEITGKGDTRLGDAVRSLVKGYGRRIPDEYQKVEYLESTGSQFLDTGITEQSYMHISAKAQITRLTDTTQILIGSYFEGENATYGYIRINTSNNFEPRFEGVSLDIPIDAASQFSVNIDIVGTSYKYIVDGLTYSKTINRRSRGTTIFLFNSYLSGNVYAHARLWYFIIESGNICMHLQPVCRKSDRKPGMYDLVSGKFFVNQGGGADFIVGPDID